MKLTLSALANESAWAGYRLPGYDAAAAAERTKRSPRWLHFGPGNIFRSFLAVSCQQLLRAGKMDTGIVCCEGSGDELTTRCFRPHDNLTVAVTLNADGSMEKEVVASIGEALTMLHDSARLREIFENPSLQMVSFTMTEKRYSLRDGKQALLADVAEDMAAGPAACVSFMGRLAAFLLDRRAACGAPLALVSMDNCSHNGEKLRAAIVEIADAWRQGGKISAEERDYLSEKISYPWTMIDKITPRPHPLVEQQLAADGLEDIAPFATAKHTWAAPFVNAEKLQYLVIEDDFPNGRPPLEETGILFTTRDIVNRAEKMKVCTCLNPLHTCLAIFGCLLGYSSISAEMGDAELPVFLERMSREEGMPFAADPGVIAPGQFLHEVLTVRLPNPFLPDTPQRIATDTSQKLSIRFGETIKACIASDGHEVGELKWIPLVLAGWLRYLIAVDDAGEAMELSADPRLSDLRARLVGIRLGEDFDAAQLRPILSDETIFGVDLYACGLAEKVIDDLRAMLAGIGAVRATLRRAVETY